MNDQDVERVAAALECLHDNDNHAAAAILRTLLVTRPDPEPVDRLHRAALGTLGYLMQGDPKRDSAQGRALLHLADAIEGYERATLPPPFGNAARPVNETR